jgi:hypothetical protein
MGAAKIRKKNGTYPTREQIAAMELERLRLDIDKPFVLSATDLKLPDVPEHARESVSQFLAPFLPSVPVKNSDCWGIAQRLMTLANNPRVDYVEGVWTSKSHQDEHRLGQCDCDAYGKSMFGAPHAWNIVDGYLVDLSVENKFRAWKPEYAKFDPLDNWLHESVKKYSVDDIRKYNLEQGYAFDGLSITPVICVEGWADEYGLTFSEEDISRLLRKDWSTENWDDEVWKPASDRLRVRYEESVRR